MSRIEKKIADVVNEYVSSNIIIQSFDFDFLKKLHTLLPEVPVAALVSRSQHPLTRKQLDDIAKYATYINYNVKYLNSRIVSEIHKRDKKIMAWTIKEKSQCKEH
ncbi:glycerophosphodiester phosphodiesterase [Bacillus sp. N9]